MTKSNSDELKCIIMQLKKEKKMNFKTEINTCQLKHVALDNWEQKKLHDHLWSEKVN